MKTSPEKDVIEKPTRAARGCVQRVAMPRVYLPQFLGSLPWTVLVMAMAKWNGSPFAWGWACVMVALLAATGLCDIMTNHYRQKLLNQTADELAMGA